MKHNARRRRQRLADGRTVQAITLSGEAGIEATILTLGATVQSLYALDRHGESADIVLGFDDYNAYLKNDDYFGATLGRYANRIAEGRFVLEGREYRLSTNAGRHTLHGGTVGFGRKLWELRDMQGGATPHVVLELYSEDGDDGFPGALTVRASFTLDGSRLDVRYSAVCDATTLVSLSNHTYFNLKGADEGTDVLGHELTLLANSYVPIDGEAIPTGKVDCVDGTPFDFRQPTPIGLRIRDARDPQLGHGKGYDHCWILQSAPCDAPQLAARLRDPKSGRMVEVLSNQPGLQFYSGNFLNGTTVGKRQRRYRQSDGLSLEPQALPDTPNQPHFGSARLSPGEIYNSHIVYQLSVA